MKLLKSNRWLPARIALSATFCALMLAGCGAKATDTAQGEQAAKSPAVAQAAQSAGAKSTAAQQSNMANRQASEAKSKAAFDQAVQNGGAQ